MAEVKNAFLKAKMNKDVDDRLMPSGEYRHAMNAQISTSESSDTGTLHTVLGNTVEKTFSEVSANSTCIGFLTDEASNNIFLFFTDNEAAPGGSDEGYSKDANHYVYKYNVLTKSTTILVKGAFLNFHKNYPITGVNLLERLLFWTDNRNQPRKIDISNDFNSYYSEDQIAVAKYNPYQAINVYKESELSPGEYECSMKDVNSKFTPNGGSAVVAENTPSLGSATIKVEGLNLDKFPGELKTGMTIHKLGFNGVISPLTLNGIEVPNMVFTGNSSHYNELDNTITLPFAVNLSTGDELIFNANPYYVSNYPGDPQVNQDKFLRFSYRFKFNDGEYSLMAPFTQICFIPEQDGYFMTRASSSEGGDEEQAYESSIVSFMQNKVNEVKLQLPLPMTGKSLKSALHVSSIDILSSESDSNIIKVIETIDSSELSNLNSKIYEYVYQSKKPYKTLPSVDTTRVYDKIPVKALAQEVISNRVVYANYQDKHTPPSFINYNVAAGPKHAFDVHEFRGASQNQSSVVTTSTIKLFMSQEESENLLLNSIVYITNPTTGDVVERRMTEVNPDPNGGGYHYLVTINEEATIELSAPVVVTSSDDSKDTSYIEYPSSTLKTNRNYQAGIVLSDRFGRQSTVILSNSQISTTIGSDTFSGSTIYSSYPGEDVDIESWFGNSLKVLFNETIGPKAPNRNTGEPGVYNGDPTSDDYNPLGWFSYKIVVKQTEQEYYNVYTPGAMKGTPENGSNTQNQSFITLINDNINKIPRDLSIVGPLDKKFRSSVRLFGRVENVDGNSNQFFNNDQAFIATSIETLQDMFEIPSSPAITDSANAYSSFFKGESDPLVAYINTSQALDSQFGTLNGTTNYSPIETLAIFETAPVESRLDIFWETSTSGEVQNLNQLIQTDSSGADGISQWDTSNFREDADTNTNAYIGVPTNVAFSITGSTGFYIVDGVGTVIPKSGINNTGTVLESVQLTSVETREDSPVEVYNTSNPKFELQSVPNDNTYKIWALNPSGGATDSDNWVYDWKASRGGKSYIFYFTVQTRDVSSGEITTTRFTKQAGLTNVPPQFTSVDGGSPNYPASYSKTTAEANFIDWFFAHNGASSSLSPFTYTPDFAGRYAYLSADVYAYDLNNNDALVPNLLRVEFEEGTTVSPWAVKVYRIGNSTAGGDYRVDVVVSDPGGAIDTHTFIYNLTGIYCTTWTNDGSFAYFTWTDCSGNEHLRIPIITGETVSAMSNRLPYRHDPDSPERSCFVAGSQVKVLIGDEFLDVSIEDVVVGDKLLGREGKVNTVKLLDRPLLGSRRLYDINKNNDFFVSEEHPMQTTTGVKSLNPDYVRDFEPELWDRAFKEREDILLSIGDELVMHDGTTTKIESIDYKEADPRTQLYNFKFDGDCTYVVNGYVVH
jgi:hypothetical protein